MTYKSFTVYPSKKVEGDYKVDFSGERFDSMGKWESSGTFGELIKTGNGYVLMKFITKPVGVYLSVDHFCEEIEKRFGIKPEIKQ